MKSHALAISIACLVLAAASATKARAAEAEPPKPAVPPASSGGLLLSAGSRPNRAAWQQRLTLGPGDTLNLMLFGMPETTQKELPVGPDGRITFLQARDIVATGLTVDELRAKMDVALAAFYQNPRTIIIPVAYQSKKYFVLGAVVNKGVFPFDRPVSVIEAIARAGGLETGLYESKTVELADLTRSFLVRNGQRMAVDFERLFEQGDLSQNVPLEPGDYLYFASADANQIYVLGEVALPGMLAFAPKTTVISAIAARGGFSDRAFRRRVLVVRGSLNHPQTFVVDTSAILGAKASDFKLQPRDIVYVSANPFVKAEDLLDVAAKAFLQGMLVEYTTLRVGPLITHPLIK